jgi:hypothetical protein
MSKDVDLVHELRQRLNGNVVEFVNFGLIAKSNEVYAIDCREKETADKYLGSLKTKTRRGESAPPQET